MQNLLDAVGPLWFSSLATSLRASGHGRFGPWGIYKGTFAPHAYQYHLTYSNTIHLKMRGFPQELVDKIIDMLTEEDPWESENPKPISNYSTVSRQWVERTRKHHFCYVEFRCQEAVEKWRTTFEADPSGISRHVRKLRWFAIDTLQGFDEHIRAFTQVKELEIYDGCLLDSLSEVRSIAIMGSSLERLWIEWVSTTPGTMATLLAGLPRLRHLLADFIPVTDRSPAVFPPNIPFFDGAGVLSVRGNYRALRLIPPTARFRGLQVDLQCVNFFFEPVNRLLASSGESLEWLTVLGDPSRTCLDLFYSLFSVSDC